ncbi:MAG: hypothetical protein PVF51_04865, partial [Nitrospirota bacterium]
MALKWADVFIDTNGNGVVSGHRARQYVETTCPGLVKIVLGHGGKRLFANSVVLVDGDDTVTDEVKVEYLLARAFPARVTIRNNGATRPARAPDVVRRGGAGNVLEVAPKVYY